MNILFVVNNLSGGGAEKVAADLASHFADIYNVSILTLSNKEDKFIIHDNIHRLKINQNSRSGNLIEAFKKNFGRIFQLRKTIINSNADVVITFMNRTNIRVLLSLLLKKIPVIITEHNYPKMNKMKMSWEILRRLIYKKSYKLVSVSRGISDYFKYIPGDQKLVIYNPTEISLVIKKESNRFSIVTMGRLVPIKNFDLLIRVFNKLSSKYDDWDLKIIGDGNERVNLEVLIDSFDLKSRVSLLGFKSEPHQDLSESDIFVLSSKSEGLGNVIIEAMKCGLPVISTDCPVGPREIIINNETGLLVDNNDFDSLYNGLETLILDEKLRENFVKNAYSSLDNFSNEFIFEQWNKLFLSL